MTDKEMKFSVWAKKKMKRRGEPDSPPPSKRRLTVKMLPVIPEEEGASQTGDSALSLEGDDPKDTAKPVPGEAPDKLPIPLDLDIELRDQIKSEIRQFGGKYQRVFKLLEGVEGPPEVQKKVILHAMKIAARFGNKDLIFHLKKELAKLESEHLLEEDNPTPNL